MYSSSPFPISIKYIQYLFFDSFSAVKNQQIAQLESILSELEKQKLICSQLRTEIEGLEEKIVKRNAATSFPNVRLFILYVINNRII